MSTDGVLGAVWLPTDGWLDPSGPRARAGGRCPDAGRPDPAAHARRRASGSATRPRDRRDGGARRASDDRDRARTSSSTPAACTPPEIGRLVGVTVPIIPMAHQYLFTEPIDGVHAGLPQLRDPDNLVYFREEVGGLCMGGYERDPAPWSLDGVPADFNGKLLAPGLAALRADHGGRDPARPGHGRRRRQPDHQRPGGVHAGQRVHPGRERGPRLLRRGRVLRPRHRRRRRDRPPDGELDRRGRAGAGPVEDGHPPVRGGRTGRSAYTLARSHRELRHLLRHPLPERGAPGRPAAADLRPPTSAWRTSGAVFGEKSGWERPNWFEPNAGRRRASSGRCRARGAPPAGLGRAALVARRSARRRSPRGHGRRAVRRDARSRRSRWPGPGAIAFLQRLCANDIDRPVGSVVYTQLLDRRGGIEATSPSRALAADRFLLVTGTAFGNHDAGVDAEARCRTTAASVVTGRHVVARGLLRALGPPGARHPGAAHARRRLGRRLPVPDRARDHRRVACRCSRCGSRTSASWAGSCTPRPSTARALWDTLWDAGRAHGLVAGGYRAIDALRLEKGYRVWSSDITPDETPYEAGLGFAVALDKGRLPGRVTRWWRRRPPAPGSGSAAWSWTTRGRSASATSRSGSTARSSGGSRPAGTGSPSSGRIAYAYLPPDRAAIGDPRRGGRVRRRGSGSRWRGSRCSTRRASGSGRRRASSVA